MVKIYITCQLRFNPKRRREVTDMDIDALKKTKNADFYPLKEEKQGILAYHLSNCFSHFVGKFWPSLYDFRQVRFFNRSVVLILTSIRQVIFSSFRKLFILQDVRRFMQRISKPLLAFCKYVWLKG